VTEPKTHTLDAPGATLYYDVRSNDASDQPALLIIGSPMGAQYFGTLAGHFADRTVVTYDPRGADRSVRTDDADQTTPDEHADDLHRLITALNGGPVDVFASSGGAVNALALVAQHPEQVRTLVAHEPPVAQELPDREAALAACHGIHDTYLKQGLGPAMAKFIALVSYDGELPDGYADQPGPDPAQFGLPTEDDGSRNDALAGQNIITCNEYRHDFDAIAAGRARVVIGVGAKSGQTMAARAGRAVAQRLNATPVTFPGDHGGFLSSDFNPNADPDAFAATLRETLAG
jgi:pimeloyl-ACP methyl ester carboxylesterase